MKIEIDEEIEIPIEYERNKNSSYEKEIYKKRKVTKKNMII
jgi:hypothetical protein